MRFPKKRLNLPDMVPMGAPMSAPASGSAAPAAEAAAAPAPPKKTAFKVILEKFEPTAKAKVIREVKVLMPQMNLVEAKAFVEAAPKVLKESVPKEEAEKLKKTLEDLGATVSLE